MRHISTTRSRSMFDAMESTKAAQAAMMTLRPGQSISDQPENEHPGAEQWLFVVKGSGRAVVGKKRLSLKEGSLLLIEKGEAHQIINTGRRALVTLNLYCPPAYTSSGEVRPAVAKR